MLQPSHDPREETPEGAEKRLRHLQRSADSVRAKIERTYALPENSQPTDLELERVATTMASELIQYPQVQHILQQHWAPEAELQNAMAQSLRDYLTAFRLHRDLNAMPPVKQGCERYDSSLARSSMMRIYANHLTNAAEARFITHRVDAFSAHALNGILVRSAINIAAQSIDSEAQLKPNQRRPKNDLDCLQQIEHQRNYWRNQVTTLNGALESKDHYRR